MTKFVLALIFTFLTASGTYAQRRADFDLCILYEPGTKSKGVVLLQPSTHGSRMILADSLTATVISNTIVVTITNFQMLAESNEGTQWISVGSTSLSYARGFGASILVNNRPCTSDNLPKLFPRIPGPTADESLRTNPTPLKWGNLLEGKHFLCTKRTDAEPGGRGYGSPAAGWPSPHR